jgi:hypothetical protein
MVAVKGIYDGKRVRLLGDAPSRNKYKVVVTFLEEVDTDEEARDFAAQTNAFDFWYDDREDLYQDFLVKLKR